MDIRFTKMHGSGNDFIVVDEWVEPQVEDSRKEEFVKKACSRHFGIGSDGLIYVQKSEVSDINFVFYNPDGSRAEMCGNGIRCLAKYAYEKDLVKKKLMRVETLAGVKEVELTVVEDVALDIKVDMGQPQVMRAEAQVAGDPSDTYVRQKTMIHGFEYEITAVGMGNPHAILFYKDIEELDVSGIGRRIREYKQLFPNGVNVHFIQKIGQNEFMIRTYERGVEDETLACGTGICASAVAAVLNKKADIRVPLLFHARGGDIKVELEGTESEISKACLIGPAVQSFTGEISL